MILDTVLSLLGVKGFNEDQPRDAHGMWTTGGSSSAGKVSDQHVANLSKVEQDAVFNYTDYYFQQVNNALRTDKSGGELVQHHVKQLDSAIAKSKVPEDVAVYRGIQGDFADRLADAEPGMTFQDKAFVSTTLNGETAQLFGGGKQGGVVARIKLERGSNALFVSSLSSMPHEQEVILPRGTKFEVVGKRVEGKRTYLDLRVKRGGFFGRKSFNPDQPRDDHGKWMSGVGGGAANQPAGKSKLGPNGEVGPHAGAFFNKVHPESPAGQHMLGKGWKVENGHWVSPNGVHKDPTSGKAYTPTTSPEPTPSTPLLINAGPGYGVIDPTSETGMAMQKYGWTVQEGHWVAPNGEHKDPDTGATTHTGDPHPSGKAFAPAVGKASGHVAPESAKGQAMIKGGYKIEGDHWVNQQGQAVDPKTGAVQKLTVESTSTEPKTVSTSAEVTSGLALHAGQGLGLVDPSSETGKAMQQYGWKVENGQWVSPVGHTFDSLTGEITKYGTVMNPSKQFKPNAGALGHVDPTSYKGMQLQKAGWKIEGDHWVTPSGIVVHPTTGKSSDGETVTSQGTSHWLSPPPASQPTPVYVNTPEGTAKAEAALAGSVHFDPMKGVATDADAEKYADQQAELHYAKLTDPEVTAVKDYTGSAYGPINEVLRKHQGDFSSASTTVQGRVKRLDQALAKTTVAEDVIVYRGMGSVVGDQLVKAGVNGTFMDHGFISASTKRSVGTGFGGYNVLARIHVAAGTHAMFVSSRSHHHAEAEMIINRGTEFRINRIQKEGPAIVVDMEVHK